MFEETSLRDAAIAYAQAGWAIFPLWWVEESDDGTKICACGKSCGPDNAGKHPLTSKRFNLLNGLKDASNDPDLVATWWDHYPHANIAVATGEISGFDALDIDVRGGGFDTWQQLREEFGELPDGTPSTRTGSGGRHYLFDHAEGVGNSAGRIGEGIDVRGDGGYIILPPSQSGKGSYGWVSTPEPGIESLWPDWLLERNLRSSKGEGRAPSIGWKNGDQFRVGQRDSKLTSNAGTLRRRGWGEAEIYEALASFNQNRCSPPLPDEDVQRIARSVMNYDPSEQPFEWTDMGNAKRLVKLYGADLRYCYSWKKWLYWTGRRWAWDQSGEIMRRAKFNTEMIIAEAEGIEDGDLRDAQKKFGRKSQSYARLDAVIKLAMSESDVLIDHTALDARPMLLNVRNGTIDLTTGELRPHDPNDYLTTMVDIEYDPDADAPLWEKVISSAMLEDQALVQFLRRALGYQITGSVAEDKFFIWWGSGANAKSTIQEALLDVLGPYAGITDPSLLMESRGEAHPTGLADLFGKRSVFAQETGFGRALNETLVKQLTGGDRVKARRMREDFWEFNPTHKLVLVTNHKPQIRDNGSAFWRRVVVVPFRRVFAATEQDRALPAKLVGEAAGILTWLVRGCLEWQREGLNPPEAVLTSTEDYRLEQDIFGAWLATRVDEGTDYSEETQLLHEDYREWLVAGGWKNLPNIQIFSLMLTERGYTKPSGGGRSIRTGLRLKTSAATLRRPAGTINTQITRPRQIRLGESA